MPKNSLNLNSNKFFPKFALFKTNLEKIQIKIGLNLYQNSFLIQTLIKNDFY